LFNVSLQEGRARFGVMPRTDLGAWAGKAGLTGDVADLGQIADLANGPAGATCMTGGAIRIDDAGSSDQRS